MSNPCVSGPRGVMFRGDWGVACRGVSFPMIWVFPSNDSLFPFNLSACTNLTLTPYSRRTARRSYLGATRSSRLGFPDAPRRASTPFSVSTPWVLLRQACVLGNERLLRRRSSPHLLGARWSPRPPGAPSPAMPQHNRPRAALPAQRSSGTSWTRSTLKRSS